jgi:ribosome biogenesis protein UTP30
MASAMSTQPAVAPGPAGPLVPATAIAARKAVASAAASAPKLDDETVQQACAALLAHHAARDRSDDDEEAVPGDEEDEEDVVSVVVVLKRAPKRATFKPRAVPLAHPLYKAGEDDVCFLVKDPQRLVKEHLADRGVTSITKVMGVEKLAKRYGTHEGRRELAQLYDLFLVDDRVMRMMPRLLGTTFIRAKRMPLPIRMERDIPTAISKALSSTTFSPSTGTTCTVRVAKTTFTTAQIVDNVKSAVTAIAGFFPSRMAAFQALYIKTTSSPALPVFISLPTAADFENTPDEVAAIALAMRKKAKLRKASETAKAANVENAKRSDERRRAREAAKEAKTAKIAAVEATMAANRVTKKAKKKAAKVAYREAAVTKAAAADPCDNNVMATGAAKDGNVDVQERDTEEKAPKNSPQASKNKKNARQADDCSAAAPVRPNKKQRTATADEKTKKTDAVLTEEQKVVLAVRKEAHETVDALNATAAGVKASGKRKRTSESRDRTTANRPLVRGAKSPATTPIKSPKLEAVKAGKKMNAEQTGKEMNAEQTGKVVNAEKTVDATPVKKAEQESPAAGKKRKLDSGSKPRRSSRTASKTLL